MLSLYNYKFNNKSFMITKISTERRNISDINTSKQIVQLLLDKGASVHCNIVGYDNIEKDINKLLPNYIFHHAKENKEIIPTNTTTVKKENEVVKSTFTKESPSSPQLNRLQVLGHLNLILSKNSSSNYSSTTKEVSKPIISSNYSSSNKTESKHIISSNYSSTTKTESEPVVLSTSSSTTSNYSSTPQIKNCLSPIYISSSSTDYLTYDEEENDYNDYEEEKSNSSSITSNSSSSQNKEKSPPLYKSSSSTDPLALEEEEEDDDNQEEDEKYTEHPVDYSPKVPNLFINSQTTDNCSIKLLPLLGNNFQIENTNLPSNNLFHPSTSITDSTISKDEVLNSSSSMNTSFRIRKKVKQRKPK